MSQFRVIRGSETSKVDLCGRDADPSKFYFEPTDFEGDALWSPAFDSELEALSAAADSQWGPWEQKDFKVGEIVESADGKYRVTRAPFKIAGEMLATVIPVDQSVIEKFGPDSRNVIVGRLSRT